MTTLAEHPSTGHQRAGEQIVFLARIGPERITLTATQVRDTVAAYLARGGQMPTPRYGDGTDPYAPLHVITEEWLWGNVTGWSTSADRVQLIHYRTQATKWMRGYFGPTVAELQS